LRESAAQGTVFACNGKVAIGRTAFPQGKTLTSSSPISQDPEKRLKNPRLAEPYFAWHWRRNRLGNFTVVGTAIAVKNIQFKSVLNAPLLEYLIYHPHLLVGLARALRSLSRLF